MADAPVAYVTVQPDALFDGLRRNIFHLRGYAPQAARGVVPRTPLFPQFAISNPLRLSRMALRLAPADLLTGLSTRTVHRTVLISGPRQRRVGGKVIRSSRRPAAVILDSAQRHISRIKSSLGLNCYHCWLYLDPSCIIFGLFLKNCHILSRIVFKCTYPCIWG